MVTEGDFIEEGTEVEVIADEEYRRVVRAIESPEDPEPDQTEENAPQT